MNLITMTKICQEVVDDYEKKYPEVNNENVKEIKEMMSRVRNDPSLHYKEISKKTEKDLFKALKILKK